MALPNITVDNQVGTDLLRQQEENLCSFPEPSDAKLQPGIFTAPS